MYVSGMYVSGTHGNAGRKKKRLFTSTMLLFAMLAVTVLT
jgi:hypothetical protein